MTTTPTPPLEDVKAIRDALAEFNRRFTSANSADVGPRVSVPTAEWRELRARLLAHIDAQAVRLEAAVLAEREACAQICDSMPYRAAGAGKAAQAIRSRAAIASEAKP